LEELDLANGDAAIGAIQDAFDQTSLRIARSIRKLWHGFETNLKSQIDNHALARLGSTSMNTLRAALIPGLIAGVISIFTSWILMGGIFHRFQRETPQTWRAEGPASYTFASLLHIFAAVAIACLFTLMVRFNVGIFSGGWRGSCLFAFSLWGAVAFPMIVESALFVRIHRLVVLGRLLDWLVTALLACLITGWWLQR
jgi:hypothetical protein